MAPPRMSAEARRHAVLEAAMHEFGRAGFDSVSTAAIAARAGVSQPYVFRLFGTKKDLYVASIGERTRQVLDAFRAAVDASTEAPLDAMAAAYLRLLDEDPYALRCQLHAWAATSDPEIAAVARTSYLAIWREALDLSGVSGDEIRDFMAQGMLLTVVAALDLRDLYDHPDLGTITTPED